MSSSNYTTEESSSDRNVEIWKIKKLIKSLEMARGWVVHHTHIPIFRSSCTSLARLTSQICAPLKCPFIVIRNGTSMISLIIPPKDQISRVSKMLADEFGTASNIKSRVNRLSVLGAITSVQHRLKLYTKGNHNYPQGCFANLDGKCVLVGWYMLQMKPC